MTPWVTPSAGTSRVARAAALQFGHGGDAVGDARPRSEGGGVANRLQFGHGGDAVGDTFSGVGLVRRPALQFGHGGDAVGDRIGAENATAEQLASIRPRR